MALVQNVSFSFREWETMPKWVTFLTHYLEIYHKHNFFFWVEKFNSIATHNQWLLSDLKAILSFFKASPTMNVPPELELFLTFLSYQSK
jgi:hypothetical protein